MADYISVLIADDNIEFAKLLEKFINREKDMKVAGIAGDGLQALELITTMYPDVVILDLIMPNLDGLGVLERLSTSESDIDPKPVYIMLSAIGQDVFIKRAISLGAEYYLVKPFDASVLVKRIRQLVAERNNDAHQRENLALRRKMARLRLSRSLDIEYRITALMRHMGIPPHLTGYNYIREAVLYTVNNSRTACPVTKVIYPEVARKFNTSPKKVERAIRSAIESAWSKSGQATFNQIPGLRGNGKVRKPTNAEFLALMAEKVRIVE